jgi:putative addiction module component (TIGR02574 family)
MNSASIFELSPSEKLHLVEDLWDNLARHARSHTNSRPAKAGISAQKNKPNEKPRFSPPVGRGKTQHS